MKRAIQEQKVWNAERGKSSREVATSPSTAPAAMQTAPKTEATSHLVQRCQHGVAPKNGIPRRTVPVTQNHLQYFIESVGMSRSVTPATQNDLIASFETVRNERFCNFPPRHGNSATKQDNPPTPALAKAGAAPGTTGGVELIFLTCPSVKPPGGFSDAIRTPSGHSLRLRPQPGHTTFGRRQATACDSGHSLCRPLRPHAIRTPSGHSLRLRPQPLWATVFGFRGLQDYHLAAVKSLKRPPGAAQATVFGFRGVQDCHLAAIKNVKRPPAPAQATVFGFRCLHDSHLAAVKSLKRPSEGRSGHSLWF